ncbi:unnamed protein product [Pieris macdunnoughi]|uniref:Uncharacterized protein n=1 Tax=Pieris macdunnoughi TaxID=345717 RepID=A0A821XLE2_9NEOP|nr:unnamed protein product [Pieris macdunnoughi]
MIDKDTYIAYTRSGRAVAQKIVSKGVSKEALFALKAWCLPPGPGDSSGKILITFIGELEPAACCRSSYALVLIFLFTRELENYHRLRHLNFFYFTLEL